jgi:hypothetical protein
MSSSDEYPSTLDILGVSLPVPVSSLIWMQQVFWALGYVCLLGSILYKKQYVGLPFAALVLNFGWEFTFGMIWVEQLGWEAHGHRGWMLLNFIVLYQYVQLEFTDDKRDILWSKIGHRAVLSVSIWSLLAAFVMETNDYGGVYSSFLVRFLTSLLTTQQLLESTAIPPAWYETVLPGIFRLLSTTCTSLVFSKLVDHSILLSFLFVGCFLWDSLYVTIALHRFYSVPKEKSD